MGESRGQIFHLEAGGKLVALEESPFELEEHFESLIADHPNLLPGDQVDPEDPRRWLVVGRQVEIPSESTSWALDLLLVDQDGIPTFVELKKGSNPELRRKVVGQMLDYAANAPIFWPPGSLRARFEARCSARERDPGSALAEGLQVEKAAEEFWAQVDQNLKARKIRLLFVTGRMVPELRRVVEFLNQSMAVLEVLAIEIRRFAGAGPSTLVPTVYGRTLASEEKKSSSSARGPAWTADRFMAEVEKLKGTEARQTAEAILSWARSQGAQEWWGHGAKQGSFTPVVDVEGAQVYPFLLWTYGKVEMQFEYLKRHTPFDNPAERNSLRVQVNQILGKEYLPADNLDYRPSFELALLTDDAKRTAFLELMARVPERVRSAKGA